MPRGPAELRKCVEGAVPMEIELRFRPMFGGISVYADGRMSMWLSNAGLALRLGEPDRVQLLRLEGAKPFRHVPAAPPSKSYVVVPESMFADPMTLGEWIAKSAEFAKIAPRPKTRKGR